MNNTTDELRIYFARIQPLYRELFGMAHAICGNYELAEYAMQKAILEGWTRSALYRRRVGFRESLRASLKRIAAAEALRARTESPETTWNGLESAAGIELLDDGYDRAEDTLLIQLVAREEVPLQRMLMLRYGCGLRINSVAKIAGVNTNQAQAQLARFEARTRRKLPAKMRRNYDHLMAHILRDDLVQTGANVPDPGTVFRTFEVEASQSSQRASRKFISKAAVTAIFVVLAVFLAMMFWVIAVLIQGPQMQADVVGGQLWRVLSMM